MIRKMQTVIRIKLALPTEWKRSRRNKLNFTSISSSIFVLLLKVLANSSKPERGCLGEL